jgi:hypothetical protein
MLDMTTQEENGVQKKTGVGQKSPFKSVYNALDPIILEKYFGTCLWTTSDNVYYQK